MVTELPCLLEFLDKCLSINAVSMMKATPHVFISFVFHDRLFSLFFFVDHIVFSEFST
jgi:hypothetical protein